MLNYAEKRAATTGLKHGRKLVHIAALLQARRIAVKALNSR